MTNTSAPELLAARLLADRLRWIAEQHGISLTLAQEVCDKIPEIIKHLDRLALRSPVSGVHEVREALEPFAKISQFVEYTDFRDGNIVHRQYDRKGNRIELTKDDFRRAAEVYAALANPAGKQGASELMAMVTISSTGKTITIECEDHDTKDAIYDLLESGAALVSESKPVQCGVNIGAYIDEHGDDGR